MRKHKSLNVPSREAFGSWLVSRGLTGLAVEIGVHQAEFAAAFMANWPGQYLGIDPWRVLPDYQDSLVRSDCKKQEDRDRDYRLACEVLEPFDPRVMLLRALSSNAATIVADGVADFIYIDARHEYDSIRGDLTLWWPKLRPGGVLAGHDYDGCWLPTVGRAVDEFAEAHGLEVWLVSGSCGYYGSWYLMPE